MKQKEISSISEQTKEAVFKRQKGRSIFAPYLPITKEMCCCHFVSRTGNDRGCHASMSKGIGAEWNIFGCYQTTWKNEHLDFDEGRKVGNLTNEQAIKVVHNHLALNYTNWSVDKCHYHKGYGEKDYGVGRNY